MPNLPSARQKTTVPRQSKPGRKKAESVLFQAFNTFTQAADSLEKSYGYLQVDVARLAGELAQANSDLAQSLEENARVRSFLAQILQGLPCGVLVCDDFHQLRMVNPEARRLLGLNASWSPEDGAAAPATLNRFVAQLTAGDPVPELEWTPAPPAQGRFFGIAQACVSASEQTGGETIWMFWDKTRERRQALESEKARRNQALAEIATVLAHEIRNPLGSLELFAGLLADTASIAPEARQWVGHIQAGVRMLSATVNNVLQYHSEPALTTVPVQLDRLLSGTMDFLGPLARQRGIQMRFDNRAGKVLLQADTHRLQQVFFNLALNAFRSMSSGGWLQIHVDRARGTERPGVQIDFEDQGAGIPADQLDKIFEPGFTTHPGSPGLGLSVCKKVIEQHTGTMRVQSEERLGSVFTVTLPIAGEAA